MDKWNKSICEIERRNHLRGAIFAFFGIKRLVAGRLTVPVALAGRGEEGGNEVDVLEFKICSEVVVVCASGLGLIDEAGN